MTIWQDLRHGLRMLLKNPGFGLIAVVSIGLGVGATGAMFSVADALVLRPLPVPRAGEVVTISATSTAVGARNPNLSHPEFVDLRQHARSFDELVAYTLVVTSFADRPNEPAQRKVGMAVSGNLFEAMEVRPAHGRGFRRDEGQVAGRDAVVILDHVEWEQRFAADPQVINRRLHIGGVEFIIVGVAPAGFTGIDHDVRPAFYVPLAMLPNVQSGVPADALTQREFRSLVVKGRLRSGMTMAQARQDVQQIAVDLEQSYPDTNRNRSLAVRTELEAYNAGGFEGGDLGLVTMLMTLALVVLVVACANVAGLLTSRAPVRAREIALRLALGAGRLRVLRQLVTEALLIAVGGGALGLVAAYGVIRVFQQLEFPTDFPLKLTFELDTRVVAVVVAVAAAAAILSGLVPAWQATRTDLVSSLKDPTAAASRRSHLWGRSVLVCGQVALSLVLLTVSAFMFRAVQAHLNSGPGFRTDRVLMLSFDPGLARYDEPQANGFYRLLKERAEAVPGVRSVALTSSIPMKVDTLERSAIAPDGFEFPAGTDNVRAWSARVDEDYFDTMGIRVISGRGFRSTDTVETTRVAVVSDTLARHYWPGQNAVGKRVRLDDQERVLAEIVGVVSDVKHVSILDAPTETLYLPRTQAPAIGASTLIVHTDGNAAAIAGPLREIVRAIDPNMPVFGVRTMEDFYFSRAIHTTNLIVGSVSGMGTIGLVMAIVGLYGLVSYAASRRTREIGIRMAVGAHPRSVLRMVLRHGLVLAGLGIAIGVVASAAAGDLLRAVFPSTGGMGFSVYLLVVPTIVAVTMLAAYIPARRASRIDPLRALRQE